ncbi:hypothetical protein UT300012_23320 [Paraclostridium bifermentans]
MLKVSNPDIVDFSKLVVEEFKKGGKAPLLFSDYMQNALGVEYRKLPEDQHTVIKIPKSLNELQLGDMEPLREIVIDSYPIVDGTPYWFKESKDGVDIHFGYKNGDSRFPSDIQFNDHNKHMLLGGISGMGKSVALNCIIFGMAKAYAPWELTLTMADAKVVEFKQFASKGILPHIESIAATSDTDYIISVLEHKRKEMMKVNNAFAASGTGAKNIMQFREMTGLCLPRNVIVIDECQALFSNAGRKATLVAKILDAFARLGRNAGYHIILASQGLTGDLDKDLIAQINVRACLGATADVSSKILGNEMARTIKQKGRMFVNLYPEGAPKNEDYNQEFRVPFQPPSEFNRDKLILEKLGKDFKFKKELNFYDEASVIYEKDYPNFIRRFDVDENVIYLGEPSYFMEGKDKVLKLEMKQKDGDNFTIVNHNAKHIERYVKMFRDNVLAHPKVPNIVLYNDEEQFLDWKLNLLTGVSAHFRETTNPYYRAAIDGIRNRKIMVDVDVKAFAKGQTSTAGDEAYDTAVKYKQSLAGDANRIRANYIMQELQTPAMQEVLKLKNMFDEDAKRKILHTQVFNILQMYEKYDFSTKQVERKKLPLMYVWLLGIDKVFGLGRSPKNAMQEELLKACQDSSLYNVRFIIATSTTKDMNFLKEVGTYYILDANKQADIRTVGASDTYPNELGENLGVLYNRNQDETYKFKKMFLPGELPGN